MQIEKHFGLGRPNRLYRIDIDAYMRRVEDTVYKYKKPDTDIEVWYVRGRRDPLPDRATVEKYKGKPVLKNTPWHPCYSIPMLQDMLEYFQYAEATEPRLFIENPVKAGRRIYMTNTDDTMEDIVVRHAPNITYDDMYLVLELFNKMDEEVLRPIFSARPDNIYILNTDTNMYNLLEYREIGAYRLKEITDDG